MPIVVPPAGRTSRSRPLIAIRPARPDEAAALTALTLRSKAHWGYDAGFMAACAPELTVTPEMIRDHPAYVAVEDGRPVGFYLLQPIAGGWPAGTEGGVEISFLFVEPEFIGRGCGAILVGHARGTALALGYDALIIQGDPHAAGFYEAMGADRLGVIESGSVAGRRLPVYRIPLAGG